MQSPKLYIFIGYPGAGKTTVAQLISERTGAKHLWADMERHKLFTRPTHSQDESNELYEKLNNAADYLLSKGKSVVFDTNFNFKSDRDKLREIAKKYNAKMVLIWVTTPLEISRKRSVMAHKSRNNYEMNMSEERFDSIAEKLEPPKDDENFISINGTSADKKTILDKLGL